MPVFESNIKIAKASLTIQNVDYGFVAPRAAAAAVSGARSELLVQVNEETLRTYSHAIASLRAIVALRQHRLNTNNLNIESVVDLDGDLLFAGENVALNVHFLSSAVT